MSTLPHVTIELNEVSEKIIQAELFDLSGRSVKRETYPASKTIVFETDGLANGTYLLKLNANETTYTQRISIVK